MYEWCTADKWLVGKKNLQEMARHECTATAVISNCYFIEKKTSGSYLNLSEHENVAGVHTSHKIIQHKEGKKYLPYGA